MSIEVTSVRHCDRCGMTMGLVGEKEAAAILAPRTETEVEE